MRKFLIVGTIIACAFSTRLWAPPQTQPAVVVVSSAPSGSCTANEIRMVKKSGVEGGDNYACLGGVWTRQPVGTREFAATNFPVAGFCVTVDPNDVTKVLFSACGSGGGGGTSTVQEDGVSLTTSAAILNVASGLDISVSSVNQPSDKVTFALDYVENPPTLGTTEINGTLGVSQGGTGSNSAPAALNALGAAANGVNNDITAITGLTTPLSEALGGTGRNADTYMTDDDILIYDTSSGTFLNSDVPACTDTGGNHLNYDASTNTISCGNSSSGGSGSGYATIQNAASSLTTRTILNVATSGSGTALAAADNSGSTRTDLTLTTTPTGASSVVGSARALTGGAGIGTLGDLSADRTVATASQEAAFLADGGTTGLTCTSSQGAGSMQVMDAGTLQWCDGAASPAIHTGAFGDAAGAALKGNNANNFFLAGTLNITNGGTGRTDLGSNTQCAYTIGTALAFDAGCTYDAALNKLTVDVLETIGGADGTWGDTFRENTVEPSGPSGGFQFLYSLNNNLYNKDDDDGTNERLMLDSENVTGDITVSVAGVAAIGNDKITEAMLKAVDTPADEECLSYEATVGDFEWQACGTGPGGGNVAADAIWDVAGDLAVATANDIATRLPIGVTNGMTLVVDTAQTTKMKWQASILAEETSPAAGQLLIYDGTDSYDNKTLSGDIASVSSAGAVVIADNAVDGTDIQIGGGAEASGDVMYFNGTDWVRLAKGTAGQVLEMDVSGLLPAWGTDDGAGGGAPTTLDYLVGTATASLSAEIVVGTSPGGELGGSWSSPTLDDSVTVAGWTLTTATITDPTTLQLTDSAAPAPTIEGDITWENDDDHIIVGDGSSGNVEFVPAEDVSGAITMNDSGVTEVAATVPGTGLVINTGTTPDSIDLALTELSTATFGTGAFTALTFDAGATDPTFTMASNSVTVTNAATFDFVNNSIATADLATEVRSMYWGAGSLSVDGTQCVTPAEVTLNSGPKLYTIICADNDSSTIYGSSKMPDSWDGGTVTFEMIYAQTAADTSAMNSDIAAQCYGNGETVGSTWNEQAIDDAAVTGSNKNDFTTSAAVTPAGTCAAGDMLYWRWQLDATGTTTAVATLNIIGFKMEYTSNIGD